MASSSAESRTTSRSPSTSPREWSEHSSTTQRTNRGGRAAGAILALALVLTSTTLPSRAARPLLDQHQWDAYFALFARDVSVPWKAASVRLDTYSGAPVDFAAYEVD